MRELDRQIRETLKKFDSPIPFKVLREAMEKVVAVKPSKLKYALVRMRQEGNLRVFEIGPDHYQAK